MRVFFTNGLSKTIYDTQSQKGTSQRVKPMVRLYIYSIFSPRY
uniref:Uncharacterized protein n=1 Tax=Anguilla anguilla TaxID=7936 RepID=A0A0E9XWH9_ANGAN